MGQKGGGDPSEQAGAAAARPVIEALGV